MPDLAEAYVAPDSLLLDPNNYRFQDTDNFVFAAEERFQEDSVQRKAYQRLRSEDGLQALKNSIQRNGYIPAERIVVRPFGDGRYLVIEGNRRLTAIKWILEDHEAGVAVSQEVLNSIQSLPVIIVEQDAIDEVFRASLMGIRHVSGIKQWGGYQRSKLIVHMRDNLALDTSDIAERLALSAHEVNRRYRAFKALQQMQEDEEYSDRAKPSMYPLFHEAVSLTDVKTWLKWDDATYRFTDPETLAQFYDLITPSESAEDDTVAEPKISTKDEVRELRGILTKPEAKRVLLDPSRSFQDAITAARQEELSQMWAWEVGAAIRSLETMGIRDLKSLNEEDLGLLQKLARIVNERIDDHNRFVGQTTAVTSS